VSAETPAEAAAATDGQPPVAPILTADDRPELPVAAAFAGGLALALLLKRLAR
jgi:hypothetical protein